MSGIPEDEPKQPDPKKEFICGFCGQIYYKKSSLNKHRNSLHGDHVKCLICQTKLQYNDTIALHMRRHHDIQKVFTCSCCNWTFSDRKSVCVHTKLLKTTGKPGTDSVIAISTVTPGSLSQQELRGTLGKGETTEDSSPQASAPETDDSGPLVIETPIHSQIDGATGNPPAVSMPMGSSSASSTTSMSSETVDAPSAETPDPTHGNVLAAILNEATEQNIGMDDLVKNYINFISSEQENRRESGIGSAAMSSTSTSSASSCVEVSLSNTPNPIQMIQKDTKKRSRIDDICLGLAAKKSSN